MRKLLQFVAAALAIMAILATTTATASAGEDDGWLHCARLPVASHGLCADETEKAS